LEYLYQQIIRLQIDLQHIKGLTEDQGLFITAKINEAIAEDKISQPLILKM
jgi:hypothetical protein